MHGPNDRRDVLLRERDLARRDSVFEFVNAKPLSLFFNLAVSFVRLPLVRNLVRRFRAEVVGRRVGRVQWRVAESSDSERGMDRVCRSGRLWHRILVAEEAGTVEAVWRSERVCTLVQPPSNNPCGLLRRR